MTTDSLDKKKLQYSTGTPSILPFFIIASIILGLAVIYLKISTEYNQYNYAVIKNLDLSDENVISSRLDNNASFKNHSTLTVTAQFYDEKKSQVSLSVKDGSMQLTIFISDSLFDDSDPNLSDFQKEMRQSFENLKNNFTKTSNREEAYLVTQQFVSEFMLTSNKYEK